MKAVLDWLNRSAQTSETKVLLVAVLWALAARFIPGVPLDLPMDLSAAGLGQIVASPGTLLVYVMGRVVVKAFADGQFPFQPTASLPHPPEE